MCAKALKHTKKKIAIFVSGMYRDYQRELSQGIINEAKKLGFELFFFASFANEDVEYSRDIGEYNVFRLPDLTRFDGVISLVNTIQMKTSAEFIYESCKKANVPLVDIDNFATDFYSVGIDNESATRSIVEHFVKHHGFNRICYVSGPLVNPEAKIRYDTYVKVLTENNIPIEQEYIYHGRFFRRDGASAVKRIAESGLPMPQVIICANDHMALSAYEELVQRGYKVPEDVAVSGFDYMEEARMHTPQITSVDRPLQEIGKSACIKLFYHFNGVSQPVHQFMDCKPVFTESCGCPYESGRPLVHNLIYHQIESLSEYITRSNYMQNDLSNSKSLDECLNKLRGYINQIECEKFSLMLCQKPKKEIEDSEQLDDNYESLTTTSTPTIGYTKFVSPAFVYDKGEFLNLDIIKSSDIIPYKDDSSFNYHIISPVHFIGRCFGYTVITNSNYPMESVMYHSWLMNISNALENIRKQDELTEMVDRLDKLCIRDILTGMFNRRGFMRDAIPIYNKCIDNGESISILYFDLDALKSTNDVYGHDNGDILISSLAKIIMVESAEGSVSGRFGGDEYVLFVPNCDEDDAKRVGENIKKRVDKFNQTSGKPYSIYYSMGIYTGKASHDTTIQDCIAVADAQMYKSKYQKKKGMR